MKISISEIRRAWQAGRAIRTRSFTAPDGETYLLTLPGWRWALIEFQARNIDRPIDDVVRHIWNLAQTFSAGYMHTSKLLQAVAEDQMDECHLPRSCPNDTHRTRLPPANDNRRAMAVSRVSMQRSSPPLLLPTAQPYAQTLPPDVASIFCTKNKTDRD